LQINAKVLFGLTHLKASDKIRNCCEDNELALLILRRPSSTPADDIAATSTGRQITEEIAAERKNSAEDLVDSEAAEVAKEEHVDTAEVSLEEVKEAAKNNSSVALKSPREEEV
jgi:hypothetical protein